MTDFNELIKDMIDHHIKLPSQRISFSIPNGKEAIEEVMKYFIEQQDKKFVWLPEYDKVSEWLIDSKGLGLCLYGNCGMGKSFLIKYVIPAIILKVYKRVFRVYNAREANNNIDEVMQCHLIGIDDVGTESMSVKYGEKRYMFPEIIDEVESKSNVLIMSSNLTKDEFIERYGDRIFDRMKANLLMIPFNGKSLR
jgi:DNA replication protein DnaC